MFVEITLYIFAGVISAILCLAINHITLTLKRSKGVAVLVWIAASFVFLAAGITFSLSSGPMWYDYAIFFGWFLIVPASALYLYGEPISTKVFQSTMAVLIANISTFITGITSFSVFANYMDPVAGPFCVAFILRFIAMKATIALLVFLVYYFLLRIVIIKVFRILEGKMGKYITVPTISCITFFALTQVAGNAGINSDVFLFVIFFISICIVYAIIYWLIFAGAIWTSRALKTESELNVASQIQRDMLPGIFPPFPDREEFDIYATMKPAKEVGGDFYDFFLIDEDHLAVVMADVSGKGVPAALFMVIAKTILKNQAMHKLPVEQVLEVANNQLCENNETGMFVTTFLGIYELSTGKFSYANAGHNPPLLHRSGGDFEWLETKPGFVLAGMEGMKFVGQETKLGSGDMLYLYTDGVTEALNRQDELYSDPRLRETLGRLDIKNKSLEELLKDIKLDIDVFANGAEQADDITMLMLKIN